VHFHLKTHFTPKNKMRQDLLEEAFNQTSLTVPPIHQLPPHVSTHGCSYIVLNQDRAHSVIRLHWKYSNHRRHSNLFNPEWQSTSVLPGSTSSSSRHEALEGTQFSPPSTYNPPRCFILVEVLRFIHKTTLTKVIIARHQYFSKYLAS
jgi:hypothetical protein